MITEAQAKQQVQARLGDGYGVVRLSGYWVIGTTGSVRGWDRVSPEPLRKSLARAIQDVERAEGRY